MSTPPKQTRRSTFKGKKELRQIFRVSPCGITGRESCARVYYAQRCCISDVSPIVERGMGHRLPIVLWLTAE